MKYKSFKIELKPNKTQLALLKKSVGTARFAYNWMLGLQKSRYAEAKAEAILLGLSKPNYKMGYSIDWQREWNLLKTQLPWIYETSKYCGQSALQDLEVAFKRFFKGISKYPKFKHRGGRDSFKACETTVGYDWVHIPRIGKVKLKQKGYPVTFGKISLSQITVSRTANKWFVSFFIEDHSPEKQLPTISKITSQDILGIDLGIKELAITSDGRVFENPKAYSKHLKRLKKYQRKMDRKKDKSSKNRQRAKEKVAKLHAKIANIRKDCINKLTTELACSRHKVIVMESLKPKNMMKNHKLASSVSDASFGRIKQLMIRKCEREGVHLIFAPTFYASSKLCSCCGAKNIELTLSDRDWICDKCNTNHDRDVNAALNLKYLGEWMIDLVGLTPATTVSSTGSYACGDERFQFLTEQCSSMKQEFEANYT